MKISKQFAAMPWVVGVVGLFASVNVSAASSYTVSTDSITGFKLTLTPGYTFIKGTASADAAISIGDLTGLQLDVDRVDADSACVGTQCSGYNNNYTSHGAGTYPGYSYGDALIVNSNILTGAGGAASSIGEASAYNGAAIAAGGNLMKAYFNLGTTGSLSFNFLADLYMQNQFSAGSGTAKSISEMTISIWDGSTEVFTWRPDGAVGGIAGGTEISDPFSLNSMITSNALYAHSGTFSAKTNSLLAGSYFMSIHMGNLASAESVQVVPVPAALPLLGSGIAALAVLTKRRKRTQA